MKCLPLILVLPILFLTGCAVKRTVSGGYESVEGSIGEDTYFELSASNLTRGEVTPQAPTIILNPKGTKVLAAIPADPLAGILTASNLNVKVGKNQSKGFGKFLSTMNGYILGWVTNHAADVSLATTQSNNALEATKAAEVTRRTAINATPTLVGEGITPVFSPAVR